MSLIELANNTSFEYTSLFKKDLRKRNGQFFTPANVAKFMASLSTLNKESLDILDPGIGTGILSAALIEHIVSLQKVKQITLTAYEIDEFLMTHYTQKTLNAISKFLNEKGIIFNYELKAEDFIISNEYTLENSNNERKFYDIIISNPPYFKLKSNDPRKIISDKLFKGQTNIYSLFYTFSANLLKPQGEMIFITPRSFTSGNYFKSFRNFFLSKIKIERIHLFESRNETFKNSDILQETLILKGKLKEKNLNNYEVSISTSKNSEDIHKSTETRYHIEELIDISDKEKIIHLPVNTEEEKVIKLFQNWENRLEDFGINVSTGKVVSFRAEENITETYCDKTVPLIWLYNVAIMNFDKHNGRNGKGKCIIESDKTKSCLVENKDYILLRRFSSKDDEKRLIACAYLSNYFESKNLGIENKVNYIYRPNGILEKTELFGFCALLNSSLFDSYFRTFNGNVNVSATEIRNITFPDLKIIKEIGVNALNLNEYNQISIDRIVNQTLQIN